MNDDRRVRQPNAQNRQEYRLSSQETVFVEVASPSQKGENSQILISHCVDISTNGIQVILDQSLPEGAVFQVCVQLNEPQERFHLIAEVEWVQAQENDEYMLGMSLFESEDTDIRNWKKSIAARYKA